MRLLAKQPIVVGMGADPEPQHAIGHVDGQRAIMRPHSYRVKTTCAFEMERRMSRIGFEDFELLVGQDTNPLWQRIVASPEGRCGMVNQSFRECPAR